MQANTSSILIVDDAKFSSAIVKKTLTVDGYTDIRVAENAIDALSMLNERNANILIADWLLPGMDGLALTQLVRELNRRKNNFTYVILLTAKEDSKDLKTAFEKGVDDFIGKTSIKTQLLPRINAADRISSFHNSLLQRELTLKEQFRGLALMNRIDPITGIGNRQFLEQQLSRYLKQGKVRNGNVGLLLCRLDNLEEISRQHGEMLKNNVLKMACDRLQESGRPLDDIARIDENTIALALFGNDPTFVTHNLIQRVQDTTLKVPYDTPSERIDLKGTIHYEIINPDDNSKQSAKDVVTRAVDRLAMLKEGQSIHFKKINSQLA